MADEFQLPLATDDHISTDMIVAYELRNCD